MKTTMKIRLTLTEGMLGTKPADEEVFATYVASKHPKGTPQRDELENAEKVEKCGSTVFHRNAAGKPVIYDYQMKGFFKDACGALRRCDGSLSAGIKAYKSVIDGVVFANPREIVLNLPEGSAVGVCERPLRTEGPSGTRVALARSEEVPAGTTLDFCVDVLGAISKEHVVEWLAYGALRGLGQWRNSGKGRFTYAFIAD